jgi:decaprenyl-phosphate phosphoribosyltransferase
MASSAVYIFNDCIDLNEDRKHPDKKNRPLATGAIQLNVAVMLAVALLIFSLISSYLLNVDFFIVILVYLTINVLYTLKLKHITILDIIIVAFGFILRVLAGSQVTDIHASMWLILMTFLLAVFLAIAKRREDVVLHGQGLKTRKNIDGYNLEFVNASMVSMASVILVCYILYSVSPEIESKFHTKYLYLNTIFVLAGILRYMQITFVENNSGNPSKILIKDRFIHIAIFFWLLSFLLLSKLDIFFTLN